MINLLSILKKSKPLELSIEELCEKAFGKLSDGSRQSNLVFKLEPYRYIPGSVVETAQKYLDMTDDVKKVLRYITNAFYIYRASADKCGVAPHYKINGAYEWPPLSIFPWDFIDAVIHIGEVIERKLPKNNLAVVRRYNKGVRTKLELAKNSERRHTQIINAKTKIREDGLHRPLKYQIENLKNIGFISQQDWHNSSLKFYMNPIYSILHGFLERKLSYEYAKNHLQGFLDYLKKTYDEPIGRIKRL